MKIIRRFKYVENGPNIPMRIECTCGHKMDTPDFTNTCVCGRDYNSCGQQLAPRSQWGYETGESVSDILSVGHHEE